MATGDNTYHRDQNFYVEDLIVDEDATVGSTMKAATLDVDGAAVVGGDLTLSGALVSSGGVTDNVTTATTSSTLTAGKTYLFAATSTQNPTYSMAAPTVGALMRFVGTGASTGQTITLISGGFQTTHASTSGGAYGNYVIPGVGVAVNLEGISTSRWQILSATGFTTVSITT